jgi:serine/threonine protein kinase
MGTLGYVSPEQITGGRVDHRTDVFSFGVLMYELTSGRLPFKGDNEIALIHSIFNDEPESLSSIRTDISNEFDMLIMRCLKKEPDLRYQSFNDLLDDLNKIPYVCPEI